MTKEDSIKVFNEKQIRSHWDEIQEKWFFSIVDVVGVLSESVDSLAYWRKLKQRLKAEGNETVTNCHALKMIAADGKMRITDVADTEQLFRLIQSIPSPKAEPFKQWLAQVGRERIEEIDDPEIGIEKYIETFNENTESYFKPLTFENLVKVTKKICSDKWINEFENRYLNFEKIRVASL